MLRIRRVKHLTESIGIDLADIYATIENPDAFYERLKLIDPDKPDKPREVVNVRGKMRLLQSRLFQKILLPKLPVSPFSHGGVRGRSIKSNAAVHLSSHFFYKADISRFFPTIHHTRIYRLFTDLFECSPDVARICTRICTYKNHLALGLITSPILANQVLTPVDMRISAICLKAGLRYTRYVDDLTLSGDFDFEKTSGIPATIADVLRSHGFMLNPEKNTFGAVSDQMAITGIRLVRGHLDARKEYILELERQLEDALSLSRGEPFNGPYYTQTQIRGRMQFVMWVNPGRRRKLLSMFRQVSWVRAVAEATKLGLIVAQKSLVRIDSAIRDPKN